ncbi:tyrosine-type recombinase/integrase [Nannocystis sp. RBIL2]|uniref:tyrosine-type recombinase/integrase n=1 Tax=Nannocystis sp. RBIL2 TaxID=2996788 RepID=UPI0022708B51|nr:tyrosine-type recombinase/integrase [Nannocystis sp. RBIL2]MCY1065627.1 tyrosine-type recombinase/integrase [Nannocystis sp. RBIL2]
MAGINTTAGSREAALKLLQAALPPVSYVPQIASFFGRTPKALRNALERGTFPAGRIIAGRRCWTHEDLVGLLVATQQRPSHPKAELVKVNTRPAPHNPQRVQVDMMFDCKDPRSSKDRPLRIQKTAPAGYTLESAKEWADQNAERFLAEIVGKTMRKEAEGETRPQPKAKPQPQPQRKAEPEPETTKALTLADMFVQMEDRVIRHQEPTTRDAWKSIWHCHLMPKFGEMPIGLITKTRILDYREELQKRHAASTCNHIIAKLQGILSYAVEKEKLAAVPKIGRLKIPSAAEKDPYTDEEMRLLLAAAEGDEVGTLALLLSLDAGLRRNEMLALRWCDVDLKNNEIHVKHSAHRSGLKCTKGKKAVSVPMRARLKAELVKARGDRKLTDHVFQGERNAWMSESAFRNYMRALAAKAGVEWRGFHKGKHTFITLLLEKGATLNELQLLARHKHASTTEGYMHVRNAAKAMRAGIARLDDPEPDPAPVPGPVKSVLRIVKS